MDFNEIETALLVATGNHEKYNQTAAAFETILTDSSTTAVEKAHAIALVIEYGVAVPPQGKTRR